MHNFHILSSKILEHISDTSKRVKVTYDLNKFYLQCVLSTPMVIGPENVQKYEWAQQHQEQHIPTETIQVKKNISLGKYE